MREREEGGRERGRERGERRGEGRGPGNGEWGEGEQRRASETWEWGERERGEGVSMTSKGRRN
eukprot:753776-Hanusia_phi.AAC.13